MGTGSGLPYSAWWQTAWRPAGMLVFFLLAACAVERGWTKPQLSETQALGDLMACWSHAVHEAHDQFAAEHQVQKLALLNIRVTQSGEVRIDDDFEKLMLQLDEIQWREERFNACMTGRGYIKPVTAD